MSDDGVGPVEPTAGGSADTVLAGLEFTTPNHDAPNHHAPDEAHPMSAATAGADVEGQPHPDGYAAAEPDEAEPEPVSEGTQVVQDAPAPTQAQMRVDFGAHLEANYRRLVAQLYAITLDPAEAHSAVQDAYSRAWRSWAAVSRSPDSVGWVRRVAVRSTIRSWRRLRLRSRRHIGPGRDTESGAVLAALRELPAAERRCVVLHHMAGAPVQEIAVVEGVSVGTTAARLARAQKVVSDGLARLPDFAVDWPVELDGGAFGSDERSNGYDGWAPASDWDDHRHADEKEDQR
jgi:DNA-directed RNA polymerase specialized sigma24 family protein